MSGQDEQVVEVVDHALKLWVDAKSRPAAVSHVLAALRAAGFDVYRPDEHRRRLFCETHKRFTLDERGCLVGIEQDATRFCDISEWLYVEGRVPVGGDS